MEIREFVKENYFLSNFFSPCPVMFEGLEYRCSENAYQAAKILCGNPRQTRIERIAHGFQDLLPGEAKRLAHRLRLRPDWESVKGEIMYRIVLAKFEAHPDLRRRLLATGDAFLEEGNWWHDNVWGNCHCDKCRGIEGQNLLGKTLMRVRVELR